MHPESWLIDFGRRYDGAWKHFDNFRATRGANGFPEWPSWCFCPLAAAFAIVSKGGDIKPGLVPDVGPLGALAAWRPTKGVYAIHEALQDSLWQTPVNGDLPVELLHHLPEWCPYIRLAKPKPQPGTPRIWLRGWWVHLEWDSNDCRTELRFVLDQIEVDEVGPIDWSVNPDQDKIPTGRARLQALPLHLGTDSLEKCISRAVAEGAWQAKKRGEIFSVGGQKAATQQFLDWLEPVLSITLYLCTRAEVRPGNASAEQAGEPGNPQATKTRHGPRLYPPDRPRLWEVGWRTGPALEAAMERAESDWQGGAHTGPRPHLRRAHWHSYWTGQGRSKLALRWLHPILVAATADEMPVVEREVN